MLPFMGVCNTFLKNYTNTVNFSLAVIYKAGLFAMSTWIPLCCAVVLILFNVNTSYSMAGIII